LTSIESKLAVLVEYQRSWLPSALPRHLVQPAQLQNQASALSAVEQPSYNTAAAYDAFFRQQFCQAVAASLPPQSGNFAAYPNGGIAAANYLLASGGLEPNLSQEVDGYAGEHCFYNDKEYQDNGLGYEIPPNYLPLASQELFSSGGDASCNTSAAAILPGFFSSSVKQCLSDSTSGDASQSVSVTQSSALNLVKVTSTSKSDAPVVSTGVSVPKSVTASSVVSSVTGLPSPVQTSTSLLAAPKFVPSSSPTAVTTVATVASDRNVKYNDGNKTIFGGFSFTAPPPVVPVDKDKSEEKAAEKAVSKADNPFANFSFRPSAASTASNKAVTETASPLPIFAGFSALAAPASEPAIVNNSSNSELPVFGSSAKTGAASFADLAHQEARGFSPKVDSLNVLKPAGKQLFQHSAAKSPGSPDKANVSGQDDTEEYVPDQEFQPLVSLPEVEVKTGEEDEEKLFGERAKLYRMDAESKQWKERGIGEMKILRHRVTGRFRIVMRREQVLKLCANHYITASIKLMPMKTSETSLCWIANDYSEGEYQQEQLCIKFKTAELTEKFRSCFEDCQLKTSQLAVDQASVSENGESVASIDAKMPLSDLFQEKSDQWVCSRCYITNQVNKLSCIACMNPRPATLPCTGNAPLSSLFQAKAGEWECGTCYVRNGANRTTCAACETPKPGVSVTEAGSSSTKVDSAFKLAPSGGFTFTSIGEKPFTFVASGSSVASSSGGISTASNQSTSVTTTTTSSSSGFVMPFGFKPSSTPSSTPLFTFGTAKTGQSGMPETGANLFSLSSAATSLFQTSSSTPSFALLLASTSASNKVASSEAKEDAPLFGTPTFVFEGVKPVSSLSSVTKVGSPFQFSGLSTSTPLAPPSPCSPKSPDSELYENGADDEPNVSFEPVVKLPDNVEVKTGEEDEDVMYSHRAKLYRFVDSEWKERGIGDVKLLKHRSTGAVRVIMRREQVLKLCLNHRISSSLVLKPLTNGQGKAWTWHADDFSDSTEPTHEKFSIRFKNEEIATQFKEAFDSLKMGERLPVADNTTLEDVAASKCPGPSILQELLANDSTGNHGKVARCI